MPHSNKCDTVPKTWFVDGTKRQNAPSYSTRFCFSTKSKSATSKMDRKAFITGTSTSQVTQAVVLQMLSAFSAIVGRFSILHLARTARDDPLLLYPTQSSRALILGLKVSRKSLVSQRRTFAILATLQSQLTLPLKAVLETWLTTLYHLVFKGTLQLHIPFRSSSRPEYRFSRLAAQHKSFGNEDEQRVLRKFVICFVICRAIKQPYAIAMSGSSSTRPDYPFSRLAAQHKTLAKKMSNLFFAISSSASSSAVPSSDRTPSQ